MADRNDPNGNRANDYLREAGNFIKTVELILSNVPENSSELLFVFENPLLFLLGHAAELLLKSELARKGLLKGDLEHSHNLINLMNVCIENGIPLDVGFCEQIKIINESFSNHNYRYARTFSGFPDDQHDKMMEILKTGEASDKKQLRNYGLMVRNNPNPNLFLETLQKQLSLSISTADIK